MTLIANLILAAYLTLPVLRSSTFKSLGDINNKDPCEVNTGDLIAETAVIPCIVLFSSILILFLAYQELISHEFFKRIHIIRSPRFTPSECPCFIMQSPVWSL